MARIGSTVNMNVMVPLYNKCQEFMTLGPHTLGMALLIAASTTGKGRKFQVLKRVLQIRDRDSVKMANKGILKLPLFDSFCQK